MFKVPKVKGSLTKLRKSRYFKRLSKWMRFKSLLKQLNGSSILDIVRQVVPQTRVSDRERTFSEQNRVRRGRNDKATGTRVCICVCMRMCARACLCVNWYVCVCECAHVSGCVCVCVCVCICLCECMYVSTKGLFKIHLYFVSDTLFVNVQFCFSRFVSH